ncbi:30S ribosomal protein S17 [Candidatus Hodgkinia cicadicola]|uniref:30S ribosomal protein S17 n=2 Tax=Candidatus Hodgkinia cicadicola TaxID=573658 RepID=A0ABX4MH49_9HYPH|nr:30S ribosomal protein S17 [Candidatus Hodgkinia cicadicola]PIM95966.1 30S ribosomal protein S17 [Candidatus Hodgkinia cicadicola]PIM96194.1 30S ribosomal protein S17 [Candidatus Hodgkinia cicadicola]
MLVGTIIRDLLTETKVVLVIKRTKRSKKYKKTITSTKKYLVSDKDNRFRIGSKILIKSCSPISKRKSWFIVSMA